MYEYCDLLAVASEGEILLVRAPSHIVYRDALVVLSDGRQGTVIDRLLCREDGEEMTFLRHFAPIAEIREAYNKIW